MIIFYEKATGNIKGTIDGRIHPNDHLKMWIGDPAETARLVIEWVPDGDDFKPDFAQEDIARELDRSPILAHTKYKVHDENGLISLVEIRGT